IVRPISRLQTRRNKPFQILFQGYPTSFESVPAQTERFLSAISKTTMLQTLEPDGSCNLRFLFSVKRARQTSGRFPFESEPREAEIHWAPASVGLSVFPQSDSSSFPWD